MMFPSRYFSPRYFPPRYFPPVSDSVTGKSKWPIDEEDYYLRNRLLREDEEIIMFITAIESEH